MRCSIIIPTLHEGPALIDLIERLLAKSNWHQVIVVSAGGAGEDVAHRTRIQTHFSGRHQVQIIEANQVGRALQMNQAATAASGDVLLFLHADTELPTDALIQIQSAYEGSAPNSFWGRFDVQLDASGWVYRLIARMMNWRSATTAVATGDQAIFISRALFEQAGGYGPIALMEDVEICKRLRQVAQPVRIRSQVITSARRWQEKGIVKTILLMWGLRLAYFLGASPDWLAARYRQVR